MHMDVLKGGEEWKPSWISANQPRLLWWRSRHVTADRHYYSKSIGHSGRLERRESLNWRYITQLRTIKSLWFRDYVTVSNEFLLRDQQPVGLPMRMQVRQQITVMRMNSVTESFNSPHVTPLIIVPRQANHWEFVMTHGGWILWYEMPIDDRDATAVRWCSI
jgi:hypothetical protein